MSPNDEAMSTEKSPSVEFDLGEFLFFLILLPSYVLLNGVFAKTRERREAERRAVLSRRQRVSALSPQSLLPS